MSAVSPVRAYAAVTGAYWGFTLTDGALRMLVLLHFYTLGFTPFELAFLFVLYELFGVVTNLVGGWVGARLGLKTTLWSGIGLQIVALCLLSLLDPGWPEILAILWAFAAQGLAGIAKDLTKMSAKSAIKTVVPGDAQGRLYRWVALLTGSKNALKGAGFFLGGVLLGTVGFAPGLWLMAGALAFVLAAAIAFVPGDLGRMKDKPPFRGLLAKDRAINVLSAARFFLFGARDVWFVVGLPIFLYGTLGWTFEGVGGFLAVWTIGYGIVQASAPAIARSGGRGPAAAARAWIVALMLIPAAMAGLLYADAVDPAFVVIAGLGLFGLVFAINSAVHSYLILAYSQGDKVALDVGFYYMANAGGRLVGTLLSGLLAGMGGLALCLAGSTLLLAAGWLLTLGLPAKGAQPTPARTTRTG
jgi:hypothetical protein